MRILLLGGNGQVGHELRRSLAPLGELLVTTRGGELPDGQRCLAADLADPDSLPGLLDATAPDLVVNATAYTAVDRAEDEAALAHLVNATAPGVLAKACSVRGAALVHFSTDYIFDGAATRPYLEDDVPAPLGVYGASKWAGEQAVRASGARHKIFRLSWVYGARSGNFLLTMLRLARERGHVRVVADQVGAPTAARRIADGVVRAVAAGPETSGTWHLAAGGECSWHRFAAAIFDGAVTRGLLASAPVLEAIASSEFPTRARRPAYSRLDSGRFQRDFGFHVGDWREGLDHVLDELAVAGPGP